MEKELLARKETLTSFTPIKKRYLNDQDDIPYEKLVRFLEI